MKPSKKDFVKINDYLWEIPKSFRSDMKVPARVYVSDKMLEQALRDRSLEQLVNVASLPGIVKHSLAMPDIHEGYGFPIGGVAATDMNEGVISPGGVGYDINCGMRLLLSDYDYKEISGRLENLASEIQREVPSGLGRGRKVKLDTSSLNKILKRGAQALVEAGYGEREDIENCEANGALDFADPDAVSEKAKNRGRDQVGTLGSGNHFLEIQKVDQIFDQEAAKVFGLFKDQLVIMIHTGSRGLGHQIASDYIMLMMRAMNKYGIRLPDKELAACPLNSPEGRQYLSAMACGANFAWANRQMIAHYVRQSWKKILGENASKLRPLYDVAHNIAKIEEHRVNGNKRKLIVHRKGATRAFPPNHPEIPSKYREAGQPVLIPGSMGTASYVLVGTESGEESFFSTCHGAGRTMSRHQAIRTISGQKIVSLLNSKGVVVKCRSFKGIAEEAPQAYKNINDVVEVVSQAGLSKKVAKLVPLAVIKGE